MSDFAREKWGVMTDYNGDLVVFSNDGTAVADCFKSDANARLIAAAPEMYSLLTQVIMIHDMKAQARRSNNDSLFMMGLVAQDGAVNMGKELLARVDGKEVSE